MSRCFPAFLIGKSCRMAGSRYRRHAAWPPMPPVDPLVAGEGSVNDFSTFAAGQAMRLAGSGDGLLHYQDRGRGPAVLLGHGYLWDSAMWEPQIQALSRQYRVIAPDLWGHGASGPLPPGTECLDHLAEQMLQLMDALDIPEFAVVGLSAGSLWGAELALRAPQRVRALVMLDPCPAAEPGGPSRYLGMLDAAQAEGRIAPESVAAIVSVFFRSATAPATPLVQAFARSLLSMPADRLRESVVPLGRILLGCRDAPDRLARLDSATTLLMCGDADRLCTPAVLQRMAARIGCEALQVPEAGHFPSLDQPEFVNRCLLQWLARTLR